MIAPREPGVLGDVQRLQTQRFRWPRVTHGRGSGSGVSLLSTVGCGAGAARKWMFRGFVARRGDGGFGDGVMGLPCFEHYHGDGGGLARAGRQVIGKKRFIGFEGTFWAVTDIRRHRMLR